MRQQEEGGGLIVSLDERRVGVPTTAEAAAAQWFSQDLFAEAKEDVADEEEEEGEGQGAVVAARRQQPLAKRPRLEAAAGAGGPGSSSEGEEEEEEEQEEGQQSEGEEEGQQSEEGEEEEEEEGEAEDAAAQLARRRQALGLSADALAGPLQSMAATAAGPGAAGPLAERPGFEEVPLARSDSEGESESGDEFEMLDDNGKAEVLALAKKMLRRKVKDDIIEAAYNRYALWVLRLGAGAGVPGGWLELAGVSGYLDSCWLGGAGWAVLFAGLADCWGCVLWVVKKAGSGGLQQGWKGADAGALWPPLV